MFCSCDEKYLSLQWLELPMQIHSFHSRKHATPLSTLVVNTAVERKRLNRNFVDQRTGRQDQETDQAFKPAVNTWQFSMLKSP